MNSGSSGAAGTAASPPHPHLSLSFPFSPIWFHLRKFPLARRSCPELAGMWLWKGRGLWSLNPSPPGVGDPPPPPRGLCLSGQAGPALVLSAFLILPPPAPLRTRGSALVFRGVPGSVRVHLALGPGSVKALDV